MTLFLKAKHWQLFMLMFGIPMILQFAIMGTMIGSIISNPDQNPPMIFSYFKFFPIIMVLYMAIFFGWFWSIAIGLQHKLPSTISMKTGMFKIFLLIPVVYLIFVSILVSSFVSGITQMSPEDGIPSAIGFIFLLIPLHLFSMFCIFYCMYFVAKTLKTVELQREVSFSDFAGEFFLIWFYPIGIWIIQPKINKFIEE